MAPPITGVLAQNGRFEFLIRVSAGSINLRSESLYSNVTPPSLNLNFTPSIFTSLLVGNSFPWHISLQPSSLTAKVYVFRDVQLLHRKVQVRLENVHRALYVAKVSGKERNVVNITLVDNVHFLPYTSCEYRNESIKE